MYYMTLYAACYRCGAWFTSNPDLVPSVRDPVTGEKEPICKSCHTAMQTLQRELVAKGEHPASIIWPDPLPGAYESQEVI